MDNNKIVNPTDIQLQDEIVVQIKRVSKATTGGRRMGFSAIGSSFIGCNARGSKEVFCGFASWFKISKFENSPWLLHYSVFYSCLAECNCRFTNTNRGLISRFFTAGHFKF